MAPPGKTTYFWTLGGMTRPEALKAICARSPSTIVFLPPGVDVQEEYQAALESTATGIVTSATDILARDDMAERLRANDGFVLFVTHMARNRMAARVAECVVNLTVPDSDTFYENESRGRATGTVITLVDAENTQQAEDLIGEFHLAATITPFNIDALGPTFGAKAVGQSLGVSTQVAGSLQRQGIRLTDTQKVVVSDVLHPRDVLLAAGLGRDAFLSLGIPLLSRGPGERDNKPQTLVVLPDRASVIAFGELLGATAQSAGVHMVSADAWTRPIINSVRRGVDVFVSTPGLIRRYVDERVIRLDEVSSVLVGDPGADATPELFAAFRDILAQVPNGQTLLITSREIEGPTAALVAERLHDPVVRALPSDIGAEPSAGQALDS